jgi:putative transposase
MAIIKEYGAVVGVLVLCTALGVSRATFYRHHGGEHDTVSSPSVQDGSEAVASLAEVQVGAQQEPGALAPGAGTLCPHPLEGGPLEPPRGVWAKPLAASTAPELQTEQGGLESPPSHKAAVRALSEPERRAVLDILHQERFCDLSPAEVFATLLDEKQYLCSERTMYRLLAQNKEVRERRDQLRHPAYAAPQLMCTKPNELWSWDITKLLGPSKWTYFYLYVILDVFSRYVVGWMVADKEAASLAEKLIAETSERQGIPPGQLTLHADRGSSMTSKPVALLLADLGVTKTHSRPHVSDDNPFSEAHFKTLKYQPDFPERFDSREHSRVHCVDFFDWYNNRHHHSGLGLLTPHDVHHGLAKERLAQRAAVLAAAYAAHPERFVRGTPRPQQPPTAVYINKPKEVPPSSEPPKV